jgi:hypothetical protein
MIIRTLLILVFLILWGCRLYSQPALNYRDELFIKGNKIKLVGEVVQYSSDTVVFELKSGHQVRFLTSQVYRINQYSETKSSVQQIGRHPINEFDRDKKVLLGLQAGINLLGTNNQLLSGLSSSIYFLGQIKGSHYARLDVGWEAVSSLQSFRVLPLTLGYQWIYTGKKMSPFVFAGGGYGWVSLMDNDQFFNATVVGGLRTQGGIGIYLHTRGSHLVELSSRFNFQSADFELSSPWINSERKIIMRRLFFQIGILF